MAFYTPSGYSRQTSKPIAVADTTVTAVPTPGSQSLSLPDGAAVTTAYAISNHTSADSTPLLIFSELRTDGGPPGGSTSIAVGATKTFTKTTGNPGAWVTS
jgi:hypothetical protein